MNKEFNGARHRDGAAFHVVQYIRTVIRNYKVLTNKFSDKYAILFRYYKTIESNNHNLLKTCKILDTQKGHQTNELHKFINISVKNNKIKIGEFVVSILNIFLLNILQLFNFFITLLLFVVNIKLGILKQV